MYNYWLSNATEKGALETKAPYIGAEGQFEGHEREWQNANRLPMAYLEYKPVDVEGNLAPPPARNVSSFAGSVDVEMARLSAEDMQETTGIYNSALGARITKRAARPSWRGSVNPIPARSTTSTIWRGRFAMLAGCCVMSFRQSTPRSG